MLNENNDHATDISWYPENTKNKKYCSEVLFFVISRSFYTY